MPDNKTPKYQYDHYDFGDMLDSAVEAGSKIGWAALQTPLHRRAMP